MYKHEYTCALRKSRCGIEFLFDIILGQNIDVLFFVIKPILMCFV